MKVLAQLCAFGKALGETLFPGLFQHLEASVFLGGGNFFDLQARPKSLSQPLCLDSDSPASLRPLQGPCDHTGPTQITQGHTQIILGLGNPCKVRCAPASLPPVQGPLRSHHTGPTQIIQDPKPFG